MQVLLLLASVLGFFDGPVTGLLWPSTCTDEYLKKTQLLDKNPHDPKSAASFYDFFATNIDGEDTKMSKYEGKVVVVVNGASSCPMTSANYAHLGSMKESYDDDKFEVVVFPSNQFLQEHKTNKEIKEWNNQNQGKLFDIYYKIAVNGACAHPLYTFMKAKKGGWLVDAIKSNYTKFLIDSKGNVVKRYGPLTFDELKKDIDAELEKMKDEITPEKNIL